jgi:hypothetical protein
VQAAHGNTAEEEGEEADSRLLMAEELSCPICLKLMTDPVVAEDGQTYQRQAIEEWINKCTTGTAAEHRGVDCTSGAAVLHEIKNDVMPSPYTYVLHCLMAEGRPLTSPLTGAEMGSNLVPNALVRSLVRGWHRR